MSLLSTEENIQFQQTTSSIDNEIIKHCIYQTYVDLKWVKQWPSLNIKTLTKNNETYVYIHGHDDKNNDHIVIPMYSTFPLTFKMFVTSSKKNYIIF